MSGVGDLVRRFGLALALALIAAMWYADHRPVPRTPRPLDSGVAQRVDSHPDAFTFRDHEILPLAEFSITARVISRQNYRFDRAAAISPLDLALAWGPMDDETVLARLMISQGGRWYHYRWSGSPPLPPDDMVRHSANMHLIPANDSIEADLARVRVGHIVELRGKLVEVRGTDGFRWRSSLTREDSGDGACEVVFVERIALR